MKPQRPNAARTVDRLPQLRAGVEALLKQEVLVGFPASTAQREDGPMNNPTLGYIHENGAPEANIPARPFLRPGVERNKDKIARRLVRAARAAMAGDTAAIEKQYVAVGLETVASCVAVIDAGIPPPLADATLEKRLEDHPGRTAERTELAWRRAGGTASTVMVKPLIDTGALKQAITYAIRNRPAKIA